MDSLTRRKALLFGAVTTAAVADAQSSPIPIIDCHIHLFDQTRPQGAPYSGGNANKQPSLPPRYRKLASPLGIVGAIHVEASPWIEDNLWVLEIEKKDPIMIGAIGNLQPEKPEFQEYLDRYHKNRLFLGIRYGNLWGYSLNTQLANPVFMEGLKLLQSAGLTLDTANPNAELLRAILQVTDKVPDLRIVFDHLPGLFGRMEAGARAGIEHDLRELAKRPQVFVKVSEVMQMVDGKPSTDAKLYRPTLDFFFDTFGEDRLIFGSDWPNGTALDNLPAILKIVQDYFGAKGRLAAEKYFWKNSIAAYKWAQRDPSQPQLM